MDVRTPENIRSNIRKNAWTCVKVTNKLANTDSVKSIIKDSKWNRFHLIVKCYRFLHDVNDVSMSDVKDNDNVNRTEKG